MMQNAYELSELAEEGQGEWTGEELEIIFEGEEEGRKRNIWKIHCDQ